MPGKQVPGLSASGNDLILKIYVSPKANKSKLVGEYDSHLKISIAAPPQDGKANDELIKFLSDFLKLPKSRFTLERGISNRRKLLRIEAGNLELVSKQITEALDRAGPDA